MIKSRFGTALTTSYCTCTVLALILLQSCSGATKIESTGHVPRMTRITTETIEEESKQVLNPNTGELEKLPVHKTHTIVTQTPSETIEEEWEYVPNPDTGELEKFLVHKTHTIVTQTPSETIKRRMELRSKSYNRRNRNFFATQNAYDCYTNLVGKNLGIRSRKQPL